MSVQSGRLSPDGRYRWDGTRWLPVEQPQPYGPAPTWAGPKAYESARFRSIFATVFLAINIVALLFGLVVDVLLIAAGGVYPSGDDPATIALGLLALGYLVLFYGSLIPAIVFFAMWVHRVVRNMPSLGAYDPRWTPGGAVGRCFIPFLNFVHPYRSVLDAWKASDPSTLRAEQPIRNGRPVPPLLVAWWATYIGGRGIGTVTSRMVSSSDAATVVSGSTIDLFAGVLTIAAAVLAIFVVRSLTARQDAKHHLIATGRLV